MIVGGLDCGKKGALVAVDFGGARPRLLDAWATDAHFVTESGVYADGAMRDALAQLQSLGVSRLIVERQQAHPDDGVHSAFVTGQGYGLWLGLCRGMGVPYALAHPLTWQPKTLPGPKGLDTKKAAAALVRARLPELGSVMDRPGTKRGFHDGLADAGALCIYGFATYGGTSQPDLLRTA